MAETGTNSFGEQLRGLREAAGISQEELAERAGLSRDAVGALERGRRRNPHPHTVRALAVGLGLSDREAVGLRAAVPRRAELPLPPAIEAYSSPAPIPITRLVGRRRELAELRRLLGDGEARLVTLTGPGGVGKTRLALELASDLGPLFPGGVAFVSLAAVQDPALVLPAIAEALGVREARGRSLVERTAGALRDRRLLLVLDNLEHLVEAAAPVAELLAACSGLAVLATSRATLRLSGEHEYPLLPLPTPLPDLPVALPSLADNDAVALFVQRARAASPDFALTEANAATVATICARLDGLPLAIELAAARVKVLPPVALLARLGSALDLLTGGPRDQADRLRSMRAAIAWSYDLLAPAERALFRRLAVFAGDLTLEAAEAVTEGTLGAEADRPPATPAVLDGIASLVDNSLLRRLDAEGGEPRFGMLATIREYGLEQLVAAGEDAATRTAHAAHLMALAERAWPAFRLRAGQEAWLDRLDAERGNLRAALGWLDESGDAASLLGLAGALCWFWYIRGPLSEGRSWLERALAAEVSDAAAQGTTHVRAMVGAALLAHFQGDDERAMTWLEASLAWAPGLDDPWWLAFTSLLLGIVAEDHGDYPLAQTRFSEVLPLFRAAGDQANTALTLNHLGIAAWGQGDLPRAAALCEEAVALQRETGDAWGLSNSLAYLGLLATEQAEHARAATVHRESLGLRWRARAWEDVTGSLADVAALAATVERPEEAARLFGAAAASLEVMGRTYKLPERAVYERGEHRARTDLGDDAFTAAWEAGWALPREQAVIEANALADEIARTSAEQSPSQPPGAEPRT